MRTISRKNGNGAAGGDAQRRNGLRYAEFCTGVGGFRIGIEASSLTAIPIYANEINSACAKTYERNFGRAFDSSDLLALQPENLPDFEMMCAGFPCQPFSIAGKTLGFDDSRGNIFFKLVQIVQAKRPQIVFLENVANLVNHDGGRTYATVVSRLENVGYNVFSKVLNSAFFGVPQNRRRVYIVGFSRAAYGDDISFSFTEKRTPKTTFRNFMERNVQTNAVSPRWIEYIELYEGKKTIADMSFVVPRSRRTLERTVKNCDVSNCVLQVRSSGVRALPLDEPMPTFTVLNSGGGAHIPMLTKERRQLSMLEMKRIMGFPDGYDFSAVSRTDAAKQLANAVCPPVIRSICDDIQEAICQKR